MDEFSKGMQAYLRKDLTGALEHFNTAAADDPENPNIYFSLAKTYKDMGDKENTISSIDKVLAIIPDFEGARILKGDLFKENKESQNAILEYSAEAKMFPESYLAQMKTAELYYEMKELDKAAEYYEIASALRPDDEYPLRKLSEIYLETKKKAKFDQVSAKLAAKSENPVDFYNKGVSHFNSNEIDKAITALVKAVSLKPDYAKAHDILSSCYLNKGNYPKAAEHAKLFIKYAETGMDTTGAQGIVDWIESQ